MARDCTKRSPLSQASPRPARERFDALLRRSIHAASRRGVWLIAAASLLSCRARPEPAAPAVSATEPGAVASEADRERALSQRSEDVLFDAILEESRERGYELETISPTFYTVVSGYERVSEKIRRRRVMKVIVLPRGGALNVTVAYERDAGREGEPQWTPLDDSATLERAQSEEMDLARRHRGALSPNETRARALRAKHEEQQRGERPARRAELAARRAAAAAAAWLRRELLL